MAAFGDRRLRRPPPTRLGRPLPARVAALGDDRVLGQAALDRQDKCATAVRLLLAAVVGRTVAAAMAARRASIFRRAATDALADPR